MKFKLTLMWVVLLTFATSCFKPTVISYQHKTEGRLLLGATVHLGNGEYAENAALGIKDGYVTLLADDALEKLDLSKFQVDRLGSSYHIYPFKEATSSHSGIVLARADNRSMNIVIRENEVEKCITIGCEAQLLICYGTIDDKTKFRVDYVVMGNEKVNIIRPSAYSGASGGN